MNTQNKNRFITHSVEGMQKFAEDFAKKLVENSPRRNGAFVIALHGELGSGKTTFAQGFARGLGVEDKVLSPTFVIMKKYELRVMGYEFRVLWHIDCYRIKDEKDLLELGWETIVSDPQNIILIEWPERIEKILPEYFVSIAFKTKSETRREVRATKF